MLYPIMNAKNNGYSICLDICCLLYTDSQHKNPICRVVPMENTQQSNTGESFSYDKEKYKEMVLDAAETILRYFGFDRTIYGNKKNIGARK